jgi:hypothetical protein
VTLRAEHVRHLSKERNCDGVEERRIRPRRFVDARAPFGVALLRPLDRGVHAPFDVGDIHG